MTYKTRRGDPELLGTGVYKGYRYAVVSLGTHPNIYIENKHNFATYDEFNQLAMMDVLNRPCTFVNNSYWDDTDCSYLGFSFSHAGDYEGYYKDDSYLATHSKKWTSAEMVQFGKQVIDICEKFHNQTERQSPEIMEMARDLCDKNGECTECWAHYCYLCPHIITAVRLDGRGYGKLKKEDK